MSDRHTPLEDAVSAADFVRHFAKNRHRAEKRPVFITNHGRKTHVLLNADEYDRLQFGSAKSVQVAGDVAGEVLADFSAWAEAGIVICDSDLTVLHANDTAAALLRLPAYSVGTSFLDLRGVRGSLVESMVQRARWTNQPSTAEIPSPFAKDGWILFRAVPWRNCNVMIVRDMTAEVISHRRADVKEAILEGLSVHGRIGYARITVRGTVEQVNEPMCAFVGLPEHRMIAVAVADIIDIGAKVEFREALEGVLGGQGPVDIATRLISNSGNPMAVNGSIVPLNGAYGTEGAVIILTPAC